MNLLQVASDRHRHQHQHQHLQVGEQALFPGRHTRHAGDPNVCSRFGFQALRTQRCRVLHLLGCDNLKTLLILVRVGFRRLGLSWLYLPTGKLSRANEYTYGSQVTSQVLFELVIKAPRNEGLRTDLDSFDLVRLACTRTSQNAHVTHLQVNKHSTPNQATLPLTKGWTTTATLDVCFASGDTPPTRTSRQEGDFFFHSIRFRFVAGFWCVLSGFGTWRGADRTRTRAGEHF